MSDRQEQTGFHVPFQWMVGMDDILKWYPFRWDSLREEVIRMKSVLLHQAERERSHPDASLTEVSRIYQDVVRCLCTAGMLEESIPIARHAVSVIRNSGEDRTRLGRYLMGKALRMLGLILHQTGRNREATAAFRDAISVMSERADQGYREEVFHSAMAMIEMGASLAVAGDVSMAVQVLKDAVRRFGDRPENAFAIGNLAAIIFESGETERAISAAFDSIRLLQKEFRRKEKNRSLIRGMAIGYHNLARMYLLTGRVEEACPAASVSLWMHRFVASDILEETRHELLTSLFLNGAVMERMGRLEEAVGQYGEALMVTAGLSEDLRVALRNPIAALREAYLSVCFRTGKSPESHLLESTVPSDQTAPSDEMLP